MNILVFCQYPEGYSLVYKERVRKAAPKENVVFADDAAYTEEERELLFRDADIIMGHFEPDCLRFCKRLKLMLMDIAGVDGYIDSPYLPRETVVCSASGCYGRIIAEHAVGLMLAVSRNLMYYIEDKQRSAWRLRLPDKPVEGSVVLILGAGDIGGNTAQLLHSIVGSRGKIVGVCRHRRRLSDSFDEAVGIEDLDKWLPLADYIICALPGTAETAGLIDLEKMRLMKEDCVLINVGRGSLIPLDDLCKALDEGRFFGVGLDVAEIEPIPHGHPIWSCERLIITPHSSGNSMLQTSPTGRRINDRMLENLENYLAGRPLSYVADRKTGYREFGPWI